MSSSSFARTARSLRADRPRRAWWAAGVAVFVLALWVPWSLRADVELTVASLDARLEDAVHPADALVGGRVEGIAVQLGDVVAAGDVIATLVDDDTTALLAAARLRRDGLVRQRAAVDAEAHTIRQGAQALARAGTLDTTEAAALVEQATLEVEQAERLAAVQEKLAAQGVVGQNDALKARAEVARARAAAAAREAQRLRTVEASARGDATERARGNNLDGQRAALDIQLAALDAELRTLEQKGARLAVRAPVAGVVAWLSSAQSGALVVAGATLARIASSGGHDAAAEGWRVVAHFPVAASVGRVQPGQEARVRFDVYPWMRFGEASAVVNRVAQEPEDNLLRVELQLKPLGTDHGLHDVPLQHGLTGTVEVVVEHATPAQLVLASLSTQTRAHPQQAQTPVAEVGP